MAPLFIVRKSEKKEVYDDDDLSAGEDSPFDGLQVPTPVKKRRTRSLFATHLSISTSSPTTTGEVKQRPIDVSPSGPNGFLSAFNNLIRSPRASTAESQDSLQPPITRPRARTAPTTPSPEALNAVPIELPTEVTPRSQDTENLPVQESNVERKDSHLGSAWFRKPRLSSEQDSERAVSPLSINSTLSKELSPRTRPPVSPQKDSAVIRTVSQRVQTVENTISGEHEPVSRDGTPPLERQAVAVRPIAMPAWPVSGSSYGLLGPLPPGTIVPPTTGFPLMPKTPFFVSPRSNSMPIQRQPSIATLNTGGSPLRPAATPQALAAPERPPSPGFDIAALRASHTQYVSNLNENHAREVANLHEDHARDMGGLSEAHARELNSLRTHIALLEKQATLPRGQHLSPSGLLPLLNTSPPPTSRVGPDSISPNAPVSSAMSSISAKIDEAVESERQRAEKAIANAQSLQTSLKRQETDLSHARSERDILLQSVEVKERKVKQMLSAMTRAAEKENELKTELAKMKTDMSEIRRKLEDANDQNLDHLESLQEATRKTRTLVHKESTLRKELDELKSSSSSSASTASELDSVKARLREAEEAHSDIQIQLTVEKDTKSTLEAKLAAAEAGLKDARAELETAKTRMTELTQLPAVPTMSPFDQMGMITIANTLGGRDTELSPLSASSTVGHFDLLRRELRNLHMDERAQLMAFMRQLDDGQSFYTSSAVQTDAPSTFSPEPRSSSSTSSGRDKEKSLRAAVRKLEGERDQLSNLLSIEIRRAARTAAKTEDLGFSRLERYDSIRSRVGSLDRKASANSLDSITLHADCDARFEKARDMYEDEIRGLVKEIVLYKLDVKGYKKDLRRASSQISKLKVTKEGVEEGSPMGSPENRVVQTPDLAEVEKPAPLRTRRSTTHLLKQEKEAKKVAEEVSGRGGSVDGLGISLDGREGTPKKVKEESTPRKSSMERPTLTIRAMTFDGSPTPRQVEVGARLDRKDSGLGRGKEKIEVLGRNATVGSTRSGKSSYGKDRNSVPPDLELCEDELRPLSTVAEVGSAVGISPSNA